MPDKSELQVIGCYVQPVMVDVRLIVIDDGESSVDYQRGERRAFSVWDWRLYDPIRLGRRGEAEYHATEGGHRVRQARRFGIPQLPAFVFESKGAVEEAKMFMETAKARASLKAREKFKAAVVAGDPKAETLYRTLEKHGLRISGNMAWPNVRSVSCLLLASEQAVDFMAGVVCEVWHGDYDALREPILIGLCELHQRFVASGKRFDRDRLVKKLSLLSPLLIIRESSTSLIGSKATRYGDIFEKIYMKSSHRKAVR